MATAGGAVIVLELDTATGVSVPPGDGIVIVAVGSGIKAGGTTFLCPCNDTSSLLVLFSV